MQVSKIAEAIANDSFFTYVNLLYPVQTVSLATVLLGATRYNYITPLSSEKESLPIKAKDNSDEVS